jgi:hypothetical protein
VTKIVLALAALVLVSTGTAAAASPTSGKPPQIVGDPVFGKTLMCTKGTWRGQVAAIAITWTVSGLAGAVKGASLKLDNTSYVAYPVSCQATATNASGATTATSATVMIKAATPVVRITSVVSGKNGSFTISGIVGPPVVPVKFGAGGYVVLERYANATKKLWYQDGSTAPLGKNGKFTTRGVDSAGAKTIIVYVVLPAGGGAWGNALVPKTVIVSPGGRTSNTAGTAPAGP